MKTTLAVLAAAALVWAAWCIEARAGDDDCRWISLTVASRHFGTEKHYNEQNWGIGGESCIGTYAGVELRGIAGVFRNSNRLDSLYVGGAATVVRAGPASAGFAAALVSGYEVEPIKALFPVLSIEGERAGVNLSYFPRTKNNVAAAGLQLKWRWR